MIPLLLHREAEPPFLLESCQHIDFSTDFATGLKRLRSPPALVDRAGERAADAQNHLADATHSLSRIPEQDRPQALEEIATLQKQIAQQEHLVGDPSVMTAFPASRRGDLPATAEQD